MKKLGFLVLLLTLIGINMPMMADDFWGNDRMVFLGGAEEYFDSSSTSDVNGYSLFSINLASEFYTNINNDDEESTACYGFELINGTPLCKKPVFIEYGVRAFLGFHSESLGSRKTKLTTVTATIPVNLGYRISLGGNTSFTPYAGLHLKGNILANVKSNDENHNMFDKDELDDHAWTRIQYGWHAGGRVSFGSFTLSAEYGREFNDLNAITRTYEILVGLGVKF